MSQALRDSTAGGSVAARADAYRMRNLTADGMDVARVRNAVADALAGVRAGDGPALVELTTYRFCGHSRNDPRVYRTREEEAAWQERDCLRVTAKRLHALGTGDADIAAADAETRAAVAAAVDAALRQPPGDRATALEGVYA